MLKFLRQIMGTVLLLCGSLGFFFSTMDLTADLRIAGPMNMWPPPVWVYLILDTIFALLAFAGMKTMGLKRMAAGSVTTVVALFTLIFIIMNHGNAPPRDGVSHSRYAAAEVGSYVAAYTIATWVLCVGLWLIIRHDRRREIN